MKMNMKTKLTLALLSIVLSCTSLSGTLVSANSDGIMQLPVFFVYASDSDSTEVNDLKANTDWRFQKSLDFESKPVVIQVLGPSDTIHNVPTPSIRVSLVNAEKENS